MAFAFLVGLIFFSPLFLLPITTSVFGASKWLFTVIAGLGVSLSFLLFVVQKKRWQHVVSPLSMPLVLLGGLALLSSFTTSAYPVRSLLGMGGAYVALGLISLLGGTILKKHRAHSFLDMLGISAALLSISSFLQLLEWGPSRFLNSFFGYSLPTNIVFSLTGSRLVSTQIILLALIGVSACVYLKKKLSTLHSFLIPVLILGLAINVWSILPGNAASFTLTPLSASWSIALDSLREPRAAILGQGPESYGYIYSRFKPNWINGQSYWQFTFGSATNYPLTLLVTLGFGGLFAWGLLVFQMTKQSRKEIKEKSPESLPLFLTIMLIFVFQLLFPANLVLLSIQAVAMAFWIASKKDELSILQLKTFFVEKKESLTQKKKQTGFWTLFFVFLFFVGLTMIGYKVSKAYAAEYYSWQAVKAAQNNDLLGVYDFQQKAVQSNPYLDSLRRQYALTNLRLAITLSNNTDLTPEERSQVVELISRAVNEGKAAAALEARNPHNWISLAEIYQNIIGTAEGADQWALNALVNAVRTDPTNPFIRMDIGLLFFEKEQYQDSAKYFDQAIQLKPDLPSSYYHLGRALVKLEQLPQAQSVWQTALTLLDSSSEDYKIISQELESIREAVEKIQATKPATTTQESTPEPAKTTPSASLKDLNEEPAIVPITEQNVEQDDAELVKNPDTDSLELTPETKSNLNN